MRAWSWGRRFILDSLHDAACSFAETGRQCAAGDFDAAFWYSDNIWHAALVDAAATSMLLQKMSGSLQFPVPRGVSVPSIGSGKLCSLPDPCVSRTSESDLRRLLQQMGLTAARADHVVPLNSLQ
jgi:hypothetical protein